MLGVGFARAYAIQVQARKAEAAQLTAQLAEARLAALRMQLNPHFLFNALNAVSALAGYDPAAVRQIVARLSSLLRRVLDAEATQEVPLRDELAFLRDYLDVQRVWFEDGLTVEEDVEAATLDALVPNLILQPLIENAVEHGVSRVTAGGGHILLRARHEHEANGVDRLVVEITDNGPGLSSRTSGAKRRKGIGLANTRAPRSALRPRRNARVERHGRRGMHRRGHHFLPRGCRRRCTNARR